MRTTLTEWIDTSSYYPVRGIVRTYNPSQFYEKEPLNAAGLNVLTLFSSIRRVLRCLRNGWIICAVILLCAAGTTPILANPSLQFTRFGVGEGLPQNSVYGLVQDRTGFLWIGTGDGLARYDGQSFVSFRRPVRAAGATIVFGPIVEDRWGRVWFSSEKDLTVMDVHHGTALPLSRLIPLLGARDGGLPRVVGIDATDTLWVLHSGRLIGISLNTGRYTLPADDAGTGALLSAVLMPSGALYYASASGLYRYDRRNHSSHLALPQFKINALLALPDGRIAISTQQGIVVYDSAKGARVYPLDKSPYPQPGAMAYHAQSGVLYFLVGFQGLGSLDLRNGDVSFYRHVPSDPLSLSINLTLTLLIDRSENLWVGTEGGGLCRADLKAPKFRRYPDSRAVRTGATGIMVKSVFKQGDDILFGTFDSGLQVVDARSGAVKARLREPVFEHLTSPHSVNILCRDSAGRIWSNIGHQVGQLDARDYHFRPVANVPGNAQQLAGNFSVYTFLEYRRGQYLLGTNHGLALLSEDATGAKISALQLPAGHYYALRRLPDGSVLAGRLREGWVRFSLGHDKRARFLGSGFAYTGIRDFRLSIGRHPLIFAASEAGLVISHLFTGTTRVLDERDGLSNAHLYGILAESDTVLWVSSNRGLNRIRFRHAGYFFK